MAEEQSISNRRPVKASPIGTGLPYRLLGCRRGVLLDLLVTAKPHSFGRRILVQHGSYPVVHGSANLLPFLPHANEANRARPPLAARLESGDGGHPFTVRAISPGA